VLVVVAKVSTHSIEPQGFQACGGRTCAGQRLHPLRYPAHNSKCIQSTVKAGCCAALKGVKEPLNWRTNVEAHERYDGKIQVRLTHWQGSIRRLKAVSSWSTGGSARTWCRA